MDKNGIKGREKSHTQRMENKAQEKQAFTNANMPKGNGAIGQSTPEKEGRVSITTREAMEYREFKRQQKRAEILSAIARSEGVLNENDDVGKAAEYAAKLRQAAVRLAPSRLETVGVFFQRRAVAVDCLIGGTGETLTKVKRYEAKLAVKLGAKELTLVLSPYQVMHCRYAEIRKEIKKLRRVAKNAKLKVWIDKTYPQSNVSRLARLCSEMGVSYFCVPYYDGCEKLRIDLIGGCKLQVCGVETLEEYRKMVTAGVSRIVTERGWEIYNEWMREVEKINFPQLHTPITAMNSAPTNAPAQEKVKNENTIREEKGTEKKDVLLLPSAEKAPIAQPVFQRDTVKNAETDYRCRLEGTELKFL